MRKNGVKVISATEAISEGAEGILLESLLEGMAEYYSIELGVKVSRGQTENALKAHHNGGTVPYGLTVDEERHYQPDPLTAPVVHEIFQRYADGDSVAEIIRSLSAQGIQTKTGGNQLNYNSVNFVIDDTIMKASPQQRLRGINPYRRGLFLTSSSTTLPCRPVC